MHLKQKTIVYNLVDAFVTADIPLEKIDKLQNWLSKNCNEGNFIPKSNTLCIRNHLNNQNNK